jgi:hypothetical protein
VPLYIICMRLGPSIPGVYVNPGFWTPKIRVLHLKTRTIDPTTGEDPVASCFGVRWKMHSSRLMSKLWSGFGYGDLPGIF